MNGVVFHTSTMITTHRAVSGLAVQAIGSATTPMVKSISLMTPNWSCRFGDLALPPLACRRLPAGALGVFVQRAAGAVISSLVFEIPGA